MANRLNSRNLCYLAASDVEIPAGTLDGLSLWSLDDEKLGTVDGVLIDRAVGRVRYFVVQSGNSPGARRYLLSADELVHLEANVLRLEAQADDVFRRVFDADSVRQLGGNELNAVFSRTKH